MFPKYTSEDKKLFGPLKDLPKFDPKEFADVYKMAMEILLADNVGKEKIFNYHAMGFALRQRFSNEPKKFASALYRISALQTFIKKYSGRKETAHLMSKPSEDGNFELDACLVYAAAITKLEGTGTFPENEFVKAAGSFKF